MTEDTRIPLTLESTDQEDCWKAVRARDRQADGSFVYGVRSTGAYCRPSCPSRKPARDQVIFFPLPEAAERAGFRPCLRCRPRGTAPRDPHASTVRQVCRYIEEHVCEGSLSLSALGTETGLSPYHLQRIFKRIMGITPRQYGEQRRLERLKAGLRQGATVTGALYDAGYASTSRLYEQSSACLGMTPAAYLRGGKGMRIGYTTADSFLGRLLVAATDKGVCAVSLGDSDDELLAALTQEYPAAEIHRDDRGLSERVGALLRRLSGQYPHADVPLDLRVTAFQRRVYEVLQKIPYGETRTYQDVAKALGDPIATRAVARACASNPVALIIPCHRVLRKDGSLGGYRWGINRKKRLLEEEKDRGQ